MQPLDCVMLGYKGIICQNIVFRPIKLSIQKIDTCNMYILSRWFTNTYANVSLSPKHLFSAGEFLFLDEYDRETMRELE